MENSAPGAAIDVAAPLSPWALAAKLTARWLERGERIDALLDTLPRGLGGVERGRCQNLFLGAVRHRGRLEAHLRALITLPPRSRVQGVLLVAGYELIEGGGESVEKGGHAARVGHHAVGQAKVLASESEARLVNAVVRKLAAGLAAEQAPPLAGSNAAQLAEFFSHPEWLVRRWLADFGPSATRALLEWNQRPAPVHARWRWEASGPTDEDKSWLDATSWPGFFEVKPGRWAQVEAALAAGKIYLQDPATRFAIELLAPRAGETALDLCAAPGGKSLAIADALARAATSENREAAGRVIAVDLPGARVDRLKENLGRLPAGVSATLIQGDLLSGGAALFEPQALPTRYDAILIDVPCSNTGVMRHRADVKWRLQAGDFAKHARQQLALLTAAAGLVAPGGRIVYSTCSLDTEENDGVVHAFLESETTRGRFALERSIVGRPWETGHDGAGAFLLRQV
jgi:16S rRNA (cytosine967-C5)-methyltransferase